MKNNYWRNSLVVAGLCGVALTSVAAPAKRSDLPSDPVWVVHMDIDALRATSIGEFITGEMDKPEVKDKLAAFQAMIGVDVRTQLHGVSLYSTSSRQEDGVLIVYADIKPDNLVTLVKGAKEYQDSEHKGHTIHSWIDEHRNAFGSGGGSGRTYAAIQGGRLIFGQSQASVASALDVIDGGANLSTSKNYPSFGRGKTSFIQAAANKLDLGGNNPQAEMLKMAKSFQFEVSESGANIIAAVALTANDEDAANNITSVAQGLLGLVKMQKDPQAVKFTEALSIKQEGTVATATFKMASADLIEMAKSAGEHKPRKRAQSKDKETKDN